MKKIIKIIFINVTVLISLVFLLNIITITAYKFYDFLKDEKVDSRASLPNYKNLKWASSHFQELSNLETDYTSYVGWRRNKFLGKTININKEGIRTTIQSEYVSDSSKVAIFLGSSLIWGTGVNDSNTIPSLFSKISSGKFFTHNFGESEYSPYQSLLMLKIKLKQGYKPDLVISYDGPNMLFSLIEGNNFYSHSRENQIRNILRDYNDYDNTKIFSFYDFFIKKPELFFLSFYNKFYNKKKIEFYNNNNKIDDAAIFLCDTWLEIYELCKKNNSKFMPVLAHDSSIGSPNMSHLSDDNSEKIYPILHNSIKKILKLKKYDEIAKKVLIIEDNTFSGNEYFYIDKSHLSPNGNLLVSQIILDKLAKEYN